VIMKIRGFAIAAIFVIFWPLHTPPTYPQCADTYMQVKKTLFTSELSEHEIIKGLKEALQIGTSNTVQKVSRIDGYYRNSKIKIPLPKEVQKVERLLRTTGFGSKVDAFELSMNRAAERAAPEAKTLFWNAITQMTFSDARQILGGQDNEATLYFKEKTSDRIEGIFKPIVQNTMSEVGVTRAFQDLNAKVQSIPFANMLHFDLDHYVTQHAIEGLFFMLSEEERKIREDPKARVTDLLKKVFGKS
jgi:hypothetical protein